MFFYKRYRKNDTPSIIQLLFWLFFKPSLWSHWSTSLHHSLKPSFSIISLHSLNINCHSLLTTFLFQIPLLNSLIVTSVLFFSEAYGVLLRAFFYTFLYSFFVNLICSTLISFNTALILGGVCSIGIGLTFLVNENWFFYVILINLFTLGLAATIDFSLQKQEKIMRENINLIQILLIVSVILILISGIFYLTLWLIPTLLPDFIPEKQIIGVGFTIFIIVISTLREIKVSLFIGVGVSGILWLISILGEYSISETLLASIISSTTLSIISIVFFSSSYLFISYFIGDKLSFITTIFYVMIIYNLFYLKYIDNNSLILYISFLSIILGFSYKYWHSILLYPIQLTLATILFVYEKRIFLKKEKLKYFYYHPVFWDEVQIFPFYGLDNYLNLIALYDYEQGKYFIEEISKTSQARFAILAKKELDINYLESCLTFDAAKNFHQYYVAPLETDIVSTIFRDFTKISENITALQYYTDITRQKDLIEIIKKQIDDLINLSTQLQIVEKIRFLQVALEWKKIIIDYGYKILKNKQQSIELRNPYLPGRALPIEVLDVFVGRQDICSRLEQLLLAPYNPPIFLHGQRRMGKTTLLNHFKRLLPHNYISIFIDFQNAALTDAKDNAHFLYRLASLFKRNASYSLNLSIELPSKEAFIDEPFGVFDEWLANLAFIAPQHIFLLTFDEFEVFIKIFDEKRLSLDKIMGQFRHIIQHHVHIKILFAGSLIIGKIKPEILSYLINLESIELSYLTTEESVSLIRNPVKELEYSESAVNEILFLTRGHPALLQYLCKEIIFIKNRQETHLKYLVDLLDVHTASNSVMKTASGFFNTLQNMIESKEKINLLYFLADIETPILFSQMQIKLKNTTPEILNDDLRSLCQIGLLELTKDGYQFQVELIKRWFAQNIH